MMKVVIQAQFIYCFFNVSIIKTSRLIHYFSYTIHFQIDSGESNKTTLGIFYTNCMNFVDDSAALFPTMARSNHSCTPNSEFITRTKLGNENNINDRMFKHVMPRQQRFKYYF